TATTSWPTRSPSASPSWAGGGVAPVTRTTARSDNGSAPTTWNAAVVPSEKTAVPPADRPTTCAFVRRKPSAVNTTAEPRLSPDPRPDRDCGTRRLATLGVSRSATLTTAREYSSRGSVLLPIHGLHHYTATKPSQLAPLRAVPLTAKSAEESPAQ